MWNFVGLWDIFAAVLIKGLGVLCCSCCATIALESRECFLSGMQLFLIWVAGFEPTV